MTDEPVVNLELSPGVTTKICLSCLDSFVLGVQLEKEKILSSTHITLKLLDERTEPTIPCCLCDKDDVPPIQVSSSLTEAVFDVCYSCLMIINTLSSTRSYNVQSKKK
jgi:hypothetical protein